MPEDTARLVPSEGTTVDLFAEIEQEFTDPEDPSLPNAAGVAWLIAEVRTLRNEVQRALDEPSQNEHDLFHEVQRLEAECDQWQAKVDDCWREIATLRAALDGLLAACDRNVGPIREGPFSDARLAGIAALGR